LFCGAVHAQVLWLCLNVLFQGSRGWYVGGETRLVGLSRTVSYSHFLQQLSKATSAVWDEVGFLLSCFVVLALCVHKNYRCA
jgi:hypothetical protein